MIILLAQSILVSHITEVIISGTLHSNHGDRYIHLTLHRSITMNQKKMTDRPRGDANGVDISSTRSPLFSYTLHALQQTVMDGRVENVQLNPRNQVKSAKINARVEFTEKYRTSKQLSRRYKGQRL